MGRTANLALLSVLVVATASEAQPSGDRGSGAHRGAGSAPARRAPTAPNQVDVIGVVEAIDTTNNRLTVRYDASEPLDLPGGVMPFQVSKPALLSSVTVGEKIRFKIDSHQITEVAPFQLPQQDD